MHEASSHIAEAEILAARVLIVDDQPANVALLEQTLREDGYLDVSSTMVPQEVLALHRKHRYDLILLGLQMQGTDAFGVVESLHNGSDDSLPVLVIASQPGHKSRALECGAKDFINQPFERVEVKARVRNMLEVRLLHKRLQNHATELVKAVEERTAELRDREAHYRNLTELASDWYWEQDASGSFTKISGPVLAMLGFHVDGLAVDHELPADGWNQAERRELQAAIAARRPFLDFVFTRINPDGREQKFQVSGEPIFGPGCRLMGYRGIGFEITSR